MSYIIAEKIYRFFSRFKAFITNPSIDLLVQKGCSRSLYFEKNLIFLSFTCNAKNFTIAILFFFLFLLPGSAFGRTDKSYLYFFLLLLTRINITNMTLWISARACEIFTLRPLKT